MLAGALAAYPIARASTLAPLVVLLEAIGVLFTLVALFVRVRFAGPTLFTLAAGYVIAETTSSVSAFSIIAYAAGLVILTELLVWLGQLPTSALVDRAAVLLWLRNLALAALGGALLGFVALAASGFHLPGTVAGTLAGSAAAALLLALPWLLAKGKRPTGSPR